MNCIKYIIEFKSIALSGFRNYKVRMTIDHCTKTSTYGSEGQNNSSEGHWCTYLL